MKYNVISNQDLIKITGGKSKKWGFFTCSALLLSNIHTKKHYREYINHCK